MKKINLIIKPTHDCNFNCSYCYDKEEKRKLKNKQMDIETIQQIIDVINKDSYSEIHWIWHGGEPTMMGIEWFKSVQKIIKSSKVEITQSMQTNGSNINTEWLELFDEYNISVGVSYDFSGQHLRNREHDILCKIETLKKNNSGVICVINSENKNTLKEHYEYCKNENINISFNPLFNIHENKSQLGNKNDYINSIVDLYKHIIYDNSKNAFYERNLSNFVNLVAGKAKPDYICKYENCLNSFMSINPKGDIYPCDRKYSENYCYGNIYDVKTLSDLVDNSCIYIDQMKRFEYCKKCEYYIYCNGGCNADHISKKGNAMEVDNDYCNFFKTLFNETYYILRNINPYTDKLNPHFWVNILSDSLILPKEIENFLNQKGFKFEFSNCTKDNIINTKEFKIFEIFNNYQRFNPLTNQINYFEPNIDYDINLHEEFTFSEIVIDREKVINEIFIHYYSKIYSLISINE